MTALPADLLSEDFLLWVAQHATPEDRARFGPYLKAEAERRKYDWTLQARPEQLPPSGDWSIFAYVAGRGCIATGTRIYDPVLGTHTAVEVLARQDRQITVLGLSADGEQPVRCDAPFLKGFADLWRFTLEDGRSVTVTEQHRFLTSDGWLPASHVLVGDHLGSNVRLPPTIVDDDPSKWPLGAEHSKQKGADCWGRCWKCCDQCGQRPRRAGDSDLSFVPSRADVHARNLALSRTGGADFLLTSSRLDPESDHLSRIRYVPCEPWQADEERPVGPSARERTPLRRRVRLPSRVCSYSDLPLLGCDLHREVSGGAQTSICETAGSSLSPVEQRQHEAVLVAQFEDSRCSVQPTREPCTPLGRDCLPHGLVCADEAEGPQYLLQRDDVELSESMSRNGERWKKPNGLHRADPWPLVGLSQSEAWLECTRWKRVVTREYVGFGPYYDLQVPDLHSYLAEGIWHHNSGKSRAGAEWVKSKLRAYPGCRIAILAPTTADTRDTAVEGDSGLLRVLPPEEIKTWNRSLSELVMHNGSRVKCFSSDEPDRLRGPQHSFAWIDELSSLRYADAWDQLMFGLRLGAHPQAFVTTTPKPNKLMKDLLSRKDGSVIVSRGSTFDNAANLAPSALVELRARYEGTRLGRQELWGELLTDVPGSLATYDELDLCRVLEHPELTTRIVSVDPAITNTAESDETGIAVQGKGVDGDCYLLADLSCRLSVDDWARRAVKAAVDYEAGTILYEKNQGADAIGSIIKQAMRDMDVKNVVLKDVVASKSKFDRALPLQQWIQQKRWHPVGSFPELEEELTSWTPDSAKSPGRIDSTVHGFSHLMLNEKPPTTAFFGTF